MDVNNEKNKNRKNTLKNFCTENKSIDLNVIDKTEYLVKTADGNFMQGQGKENVSLISELVSKKKYTNENHVRRLFTDEPESSAGVIDFKKIDVERFENNTMIYVGLAL
ncbi:hypothetical protein HHI36_001633 [Cryptolaemus montrouzieri]|uniref:Uncharacterized protein n=1 Tax=Cryptolaemus montrouzieri TaxID=559131 RepID=A0ABD2P8I3_9CUCU